MVVKFPRNPRSFDATVRAVSDGGRAYSVTFDDDGTREDGVERACLSAVSSPVPPDDTPPVGAPAAPTVGAPALSPRVVNHSNSAFTPVSPRTAASEQSAVEKKKPRAEERARAPSLFAVGARVIVNFPKASGIRAVFACLPSGWWCHVVDSGQPLKNVPSSFLPEEPVRLPSDRARGRAEQRQRRQ